MNKQTSTMQNFPIMKQITNQILNEIDLSEKIIQSEARIEEDGRTIFEVILVSDLILIYSKFQNDSDVQGYFKLDFSLKFQRITLLKSFGKIQLKGFKLIDDFGQQISFFLDSHKQTKRWLKCLSKYINQNGFQKLFKPIRTLGKGSSAAVYEILRLEDGQHFAAKTFSKETIKSSPQKLNSFLNQLEILRNLSEQNIVNLQGVFESQNTIYVVMQHLMGGNLLQLLINRKTSLSIPQIKCLLRGILKGLKHMQMNKIAHRDIKLQNIVLRQKNTLEPVIVDFGLAVYIDDEDYVYNHCGTPGYIPPESFNFKKGDKLNSLGDIFSLGVIFHVLLTGKYLFQGEDIPTIFQNNKDGNFNLSREQYGSFDNEGIDLLNKMLQKDESKRWSATQCLKHDFLSLQETKNYINCLASATETDSEHQR